MIELLSCDYRSLEEFVYRWRWTNPQWNVLPEADLAQIRPLIREKAKAIWQTTFVYSNALWSYAGKIPSPLFEAVQMIGNAGSDREQISKALTGLASQDEQIVIVMWQATEAVAVPWHIFCTYWDDFCYPSSDDVSIWPLSVRWCLCYHHEEYLMFGKLRWPP